MRFPLQAVLLAGLATVAPQRGHAQDSVSVRIVNTYTVHLEMGIGTATRVGVDTVRGTLVRQADGTWRGEADAGVALVQIMKAFGFVICPEKKYTGSQRLYLTGTPVREFNRKLQSIALKTGTADGGFLSLAVRPVESASMSSTDCLTLRADAGGAFPLLPLNDSRWTEPLTRYIIALPQRGLLEYDDITITMTDPEMGGSVDPLFSESTWAVRIERR